MKKRTCKRLLAGFLAAALLGLTACTGAPPAADPQPQEAAEIPSEEAAEELTAEQETEESTMEEQKETKKVQQEKEETTQNSTASALAIILNSKPFALTKTQYEVVSEDFSAESDGKAIVGTVFTPDDGQELHPVVILSHGFANIGTWLNYKAQSLAASGFVALTFDFRGGSSMSRSEGETTDMTIGTETADLMAVIDAVKQLPGVDTQKIFLLGESYGGLVSARTAAQRDDIAGLILCYPALHSSDAAHAAFASYDSIPETMAVGSVVTGRAMWQELWDMDIYADIAPYTGPVLILHGTADTDVNYAYSVRAYRAYEDAQLVLIEGGTHCFLDKDDEKTVFYTIYQFLARQCDLPIDR